jgi:hypothetical protein
MTIEGIEIKQHNEFKDLTEELLFHIIKQNQQIINCGCGGGGGNIIRVPIYNTYDLPAGAKLISVFFPAYGNQGNQFIYNAILGTTAGGDDIAVANVATFVPETVSVNITYPTATRLYYQSNLGAFDSAQSLAYLDIQLP